MSPAKSYRDLDIFILAKKLAIEVHKMTLSLPKFELYEEGSQIRRSSKSIAENIVEGFARRQYKSEFLRYLTIAIGECDETQVHLEFLHETDSLKSKEKFDYFQLEYKKLAKMLMKFYDAVLKHHVSSK